MFMELQNNIMKKIIILFAILVSACSPFSRQTAIPTATMQRALPTRVFDELSKSYVDLMDGVVTPRPTLCRIVSLNDREENVPPGTYVPDNSFTQEAANASPSQFDSPSVSNKATFGKTEINFLISKNKNPDGTWIYKNWQWAATGYTGAYYQEIQGYSIYDKVNWNWVVPASPNPHDRNFVCVDAKVNGFYEIVAAPKMANYDSISRIYWLNYKVAANYRACIDPATCNMGEYLWNGFLFDPSTFPNTKGNNGYWAEEKYIHEVTSILEQIPWRVQIPPTPTPIITPTATPIPAMGVCYKSVCPKQLHQRPGATMSNISSGVSVDPGAIIPIEGIVVNLEGVWAKINWGSWFAIELYPTTEHPINRIFAIPSTCQ